MLKNFWKKEKRMRGDLGALNEARAGEGKESDLAAPGRKIIILIERLTKNGRGICEYAKSSSRRATSSTVRQRRSQERGTEGTSDCRNQSLKTKELPL